MSRVTRYILRQLLGPLAFLLLSLTAVVWLTQSLTFVDMIINRGLSLDRFATMMLLLTPGFVGRILPIALFSAILHTYHRLTYDSEIMVMRAAGLGQAALARPGLIMAGLVSIAGYAMALYLTPLGFSAFKDVQFQVRSNQASVLVQDGEFNSLGSGITAYVRERGPEGELRGILVHDSREPGHPVTVMAERGVLLAGDEGPRFVLFEGNRQEIDADGGQLSLLYFERYSLDLDLFGETPGLRWQKPAERLLPALLFPDLSDRNDRAFAGELRAEGHNRIVSPLYSMVFALIALAAVLSGEFNRRGQWARISAAVGLAITFQAVALGLASLAASHPATTPLLYVNAAAAMASALWVLRRWRLPLPRWKLETG
jgi:lipopolysaccharide export system permease protein